MGITSLGPVLTSLHSTAVSLILSRGSSQETPKYMEMDMVCKRSKEAIFQIKLDPLFLPPFKGGEMAGTKMQNSNFTTMLHREKWLLSPRLRQVSFLLPHSGRKSMSCRKKYFYYEADFFRSISSIVLPPYFSCYLENACSLRDSERKKNSDPCANSIARK